MEKAEDDEKDENDEPCRACGGVTGDRYNEMPPPAEIMAEAQTAIFDWLIDDVDIDAFSIHTVFVPQEDPDDGYTAYAFSDSEEDSVCIVSLGVHDDELDGWHAREDRIVMPKSAFASFVNSFRPKGENEGDEDA